MRLFLHKNTYKMSSLGSEMLCVRAARNAVTVIWTYSQAFSNVHIYLRLPERRIYY